MPRDPLSIATILGFTGILLLVLVYSIINNVVILPFFLVATTLGTVFFMYYPRISIMLLLAGRLVMDLNSGRSTVDGRSSGGGPGT